MFKKKLKKLKTRNYKLATNAGMTYVELIVVLSIFGIMSSMSMFNYRDFQVKVDIRNLASDIAMQIVQAQKDAMAGKLSINGSFDFKPAYGVHFTKYNQSQTDPSEFTYFADFDNSDIYDGSSVNCPGPGNECINVIQITKRNYIKSLNVIGSGDACSGTNLNAIDIVFQRPNSDARISADNCSGFFSKVVISVMSPQGIGADIEVFPSGRIQITNPSIGVPPSGNQSCVPGDPNCAPDALNVS